MMLWRVTDDNHFYYSDVIGAESALDAARVFVARLKIDQVAEIEIGKNECSDMNESFEDSGYPSQVVLPDVIFCVQMHDVKSYHNPGVIDDTKRRAQAFDDLWDWKNLVHVRL